MTTMVTIGSQLVPELCVSDIEESLRFWRDLLGFRIAYARPEDRFAKIERDGVCFMLDQIAGGAPDRHGIWDTGPLERPLGRGINFEITVSDVDTLMASLAGAVWPLFFGPEERWYRANAEEIGVRQFLVQDPDGYLLRFSQPLARRPFRAAQT